MSRCEPSADLMKLPGPFRRFAGRFPALVEPHERVARAVDAAGPQDARTCAWIKVGIRLGAGLEPARRSHVRRALEHGARPVEPLQAVLPGMNTCDFPRTVAAWTWTRRRLERGT